MTRFTRGQEVRSLSSVHGMLAGKVYLVVDVNIKKTQFGCFCTYTILDMESGDELNLAGLEDWDDFGITASTPVLLEDALLNCPQEAE